MKTERKKILHQIRDKVKKHKEQLLENKLYHIDHAKGNAQMFRAVKMLNRKNMKIHQFMMKNVNQLQINKTYTML